MDLDRVDPKGGKKGPSPIASCKKNNFDDFRMVYTGYKLQRERALICYFTQGPKISRIGPIQLLH